MPIERSIFGAIAILILMLSACVAPSNKAANIGARTVGAMPTKETVIDGLKSPWGLAFISDKDVLITEKHGTLLRVNLDTRTKSAVNGMPTDLVKEVPLQPMGDNSGIFDVAVDPDFKKNSYIYFSYSSQNGQGLTTKIVRGKLTGNQLGALQTVLVANPYTEKEFYHYGGGLEFGADGKLYVTIGERLFSEANQPEIPIAQNLTDKRGKIYRLNPDGSIPFDNPPFSSGAVPGLYAVGIRAAQGLALNHATGDIWFTEHGTIQGDELNRLEAGGNYGWPVVTTGRYRAADYKPSAFPDRTFTPPIWSWRQTVAPTGLTFYEGDEFPDWRGDLIISGLSRGSLWRMNFEDGQIIAVEELFVHDRVRSRNVAMSPDGKLYMLSDTLLTADANGMLTSTGVPSGALIRIRNRGR